jgi:hypothetical protein
MKRVPVTALTLLAGAGPLAIAVASAAPKAAAAPGATVVYECAGWSGGHVLPRRILVDCAGAVFAKVARWSAQSRSAALWADICKPDCASGHYSRYLAAVTFYRTRSRHGARYFSRMRLHYTHRGPRTYVYRWGTYPGASIPGWLDGP